MGLFGKRVENHSANIEKTVDARIKVLGTGCDKCEDLYANVKAALNELQLDESIEHITDFVEIAKLGVMTSPALMIDNKVISAGVVLSKDDIIKALSKS